MKLDKLFAGLNISAFGLTAQRKRMNAVASNMANIETTRTETGDPYRRKVVVMKEEGSHSFSRALATAGGKIARTHPGHQQGSAQMFVDGDSVAGGISAEEVEVNEPFKRVHDPSHPDADEEGYVMLPNINVVTEMVDMMTASRAYEANVTAVNAAKSMAKDALEI